ncbi:hypothetical protein QTP70_034040, partial [Hemibagrus guttatus]
GDEDTPYNVCHDMPYPKSKSLAEKLVLEANGIKACTLELGDPLQCNLNLNLEQERVPQQWRTSCIIPVPKKPRPGELNDFRPVALTSHMKAMERVVLGHMRPQVRHVLNPLQFANQEKVGVEDTITLYATQIPLSPGQWQRGCENDIFGLLQFFQYHPASAPQR